MIIVIVKVIIIVIVQTIVITIVIVIIMIIIENVNNDNLVDPHPLLEVHQDQPVVLEKLYYNMYVCMCVYIYIYIYIYIFNMIIIYY